jgi:hypothetical protein
MDDGPLEPRARRRPAGQRQLRAREKAVGGRRKAEGGRQKAVEKLLARS